MTSAKIKIEHRIQILKSQQSILPNYYMTLIMPLVTKALHLQKCTKFPFFFYEFVKSIHRKQIINRTANPKYPLLESKQLINLDQCLKQIYNENPIWNFIQKSIKESPFI